jgi:hypothetical protein
MNPITNDTLLDRLIARLITRLSVFWKDPRDQARMVEAILALDSQYSLTEKIAAESGVEEILLQMLGRLAASYPHLPDLQGQQILDIACGSNTSRAPGLVHVNSPFGKSALKQAKAGYTALFEPWFCRILFALGANPVGVDMGDLDRETFTHYRVDLGKPGALDFLPDHSFDSVQDSRLFGSPEFTAQFPRQADRLKGAQEIIHQEQRLLKAGGIIIHSDAHALL